MFRKLFFLGVCVYGYWTVLSHPLLALKMESTYGGKYEFLTMLGLYLTILTLIASVISNFIPIKGIVSFLLALSFPVEGVVTVFYWVLYFYDPSLLHMGEIRISLPTNLAIHLIPGIALWTEFLTMKDFRHSRYHIYYSGLLCAMYYWWVHFLFEKNDQWVYPLLGVLSPSDRFLFFIASALFNTALYMFGLFLHRRINY